MKRTIFIMLTTLVVILGIANETYAKEGKEQASIENVDVISQTTKSIKFKWHKVDGANEYIIYRMENKKDGYEKICNTKKLSIEDKGLKSGTKYTYKIYSCVEKSGKSIKSKVPFKFEAYTKGKNIKLSISYTTEDSVKCTWKKVNGISGYELKVYDEDEKCINRIYTDKKSYVVNNLSYDSAYNFSVRYYVESDTQGKVYSMYSPFVKARTILMQPKGKMATIGSSSFSIKWNKIKNASEYIIFSYNKENGKKKEIARTKGNSYEVTHLAAGVTRRYVVRAVNKKNGRNYYGKYSDVITCGTKPDKVNVTVTSENVNGVSLRWDKVKTASVYVVYSVDKNGKKIKKLTKTNSNSVNISGLKSGKRMRIIVCSYRTIDGVKYGVSTGIAPTLIYTKPAAVVINTSLDNKGKMTLSWTKVSGANGYMIYKFNKKNGKYERIDETKKCFYVDKIGTKHADVSYIVRAYLTKDNGRQLIGTESRVCGVITNCKGIDISHWQDDIDWKKVADSGVKFAIIKIGGRDRARGRIKVDKRYVNNIKQARKNGIKVGVYFYSTAINKSEAIEEAKWTINQLKSHDIELPVAFDYEDYVIPSSRTFRTTKSQRTKMAMAFMKTIEDAGYKSLMYGNMSAVQFDFTQSQISKYQLWVARYPRANKGKKIDAYKPDIGGEYAIWQYSETGVVPGIREKVDMNYCYKLYY